MLAKTIELNCDNVNIPIVIPMRATSGGMRRSPCIRSGINCFYLGEPCIAR